MKQVICFGFNHKNTPLEEREKYALSEAQISISLEKIKNTEEIENLVILSTCNRTEIYFSKIEGEPFQRKILEILYGEEQGKSFPINYIFKEKDAFIHLSGLCSGLDSMILGETEIFSQVKQSYQKSCSFNLTKGMDIFFQKSFSLGKKIRTETRIQEGASSIGAVSVILAEQIFENLGKMNVLLCGTGEMGVDIAKSLQIRGVDNFFISSRMQERSEALCEKFGGMPLSFEKIESFLPKMDAVISSTDFKIPFLEYEKFSALRKKRRYKPLYLIDISVPRSIDIRLSQFSEVYLKDIDFLQTLSLEGKNRREEEKKKGCKLIEKEAESLF